MSKRFVIDTSALASGMSLPLSFTYYAPSIIKEEIERIVGEPYIEIIYLNPEEKYIETVVVASEKTGDSSKLSKEDIHVLALALQLNLPIISEDFSIQNVASYLNIEFFGIKRIRREIMWEFRCEGCLKKFTKFINVCPHCGSRIKRVARKKSETNLRRTICIALVIVLFFSMLSVLVESKFQERNVVNREKYIEFDRYISYDEMVKKLYELRQMHSSIVNITVIGYTYGWNSSSNRYDNPRKILLVKISDNANVDEDEPEILFDALHHAREWLSVMVALYLIQKLVLEYGTNDTITWLVNNREIYVIPMVNPDGYVYDGNGDLSRVKYWRKNCRDNDNDGIFENNYFKREGVDLNRNYEFYWEYGEDDPDSQIYRGPAPFSEPETLAIKKFADNHTVNLYISYHSYGSQILIPPGCSESLPRPYDYLEFSIGENMTKFQKYYKYDVIESVSLYSSPGTSEDWFLHIEQAISFTVELEGDEFYPEESVISVACENNFHSAVYAIMVADMDIRGKFPPKPYIIWGYVSDSSSLVIATNLQTGEFISVMPASNGFYMINLGLLNNYSYSDTIRISSKNYYLDIKVDFNWGKRVDLQYVLERVSLIEILIFLIIFLVMTRYQKI